MAEKGISFGDLPSGLADGGGCILQCQGAASSLPQVLDGSAQSQLQSLEVGTTRVEQGFWHRKRVRCAH